MVLAVAIPVTISKVTSPEVQDTRSRASETSPAATGSGTATIGFDPSSATPIQAEIGDQISIEMIVGPDAHLVSFVKFQVNYDPTKLKISETSPFTVNETSFPIKVEGPVVNNGTVALSLSVGSDPTKIISKPTKVGTINFEAIGSTEGTPTLVSFTDATQLLSVGSSDSATTNVLASTTPAAVVIGGSNNTTPPQDGTRLSFDLLLHGIGSAGDNPNPTGNQLSNKNPLSPQRTLNVQILDSTNTLVSSTSGKINYDQQTGTFKGVIGVSNAITDGSYIIKIKSDRYLTRRIPGIQQLENLEENQIDRIDLISGDVHGDNLLSALDYNALLNCGYGELAPLPMADPNSTYNSDDCKVHLPRGNVDLDDNGIVNSADYNLFIRELSVQKGD